MRDLEFPSSERRGNGGPKAPKHILGENHSLTFWAQKVQDLVRTEEISKTHLSRHGAKRLANVRCFYNFWTPRM